MGEIPRFFVPDVAREEQERTYKALAERCGLSVPSPGCRIFSITFVSKGEEWTATVGESLRSVTLPPRRSRSKRPFIARHRQDPAVVLGIFAGVSYKVVTNSHSVPNVRSEWVNPFDAGNPKSVRRFSL